MMSLDIKLENAIFHLDNIQMKHRQDKKSIYRRTMLITAYEKAVINKEIPETPHTRKIIDNIKKLKYKE